jgi:hypothetical protein
VKNPDSNHGSNDQCTSSKEVFKNNFEDLLKFIRNNRSTNLPNFEKFRFQYHGYEIPFFVQNDYGNKINITLQGIKKDSQQETPGFYGGSSITGALDCLNLTTNRLKSGG